MIRSLLGLRINPNPSRMLRDQIREAARLGAKGVVVDAAGDLAPDRLSETGRRELRHLLRSIEVSLFALNLPTRRPFDTEDQLDDRLARADRAFALAFELGTRLVLARVGAVPPESEAPRREVFTRALRELGRRADHRGVRLAVETGTEPGEAIRGVLDALDSPGLAASIDPASLLRFGHDPVATCRALGPWVAHAYANDGAGVAAAPNPRGFGFPAGVLDWEEYLGALEEIDYRGPLTVWPDPARDQASQFTAIAERLKRF
jgi:sugar phosphate isomerase/epimerase